MIKPKNKKDKVDDPSFSWGLSTLKPENVNNLSVYYEKDTGNRYILKSGAWQLLDNVHK